jgi:hypothetical protein
MIKAFCDRCNNEVSDGEGAPITIPPVPGEVMHLSILLCPACQLSFVSFVANEIAVEASGKATIEVKPYTPIIIEKPI